MFLSLDAVFFNAVYSENAPYGCNMNDSSRPNSGARRSRSQRSSKNPTQEPLTLNELQQKAIALLSSREYSAAEIRRKYMASAEPDLVEQLLQWLSDYGYQSDDRFAAVFVRSKARAGHGPMRIRQALRQKGVKDSLVQRKLEEFEGDWYALVVQVYEKKYGFKPIADHKERAKRQRFLQYRGFDSDQIYHAMDKIEE